MRYRARVEVTPRPGILDPQGRAIGQALRALGHDRVASVSVGKLIQIELTAAGEDEARCALIDMSERLLANPVLEDFVVGVIEPLGEEGPDR